MHINCAVSAKIITSPETSRDRTYKNETAVFCHEHMEKGTAEI